MKKTSQIHQLIIFVVSHLVHGVLHRAELVGAELAVHAHLGVLTELIIVLVSLIGQQLEWRPRIG